MPLHSALAELPARLLSWLRFLPRSWISVYILCDPSELLHPPYWIWPRRRPGNQYGTWFLIAKTLPPISYPEPAIFRRRIESSGIIHNRKPEILAFFARLLHSFLYQQPIRFTQIHGLSQSSRFLPWRSRARGTRLHFRRNYTSARTKFSVLTLHVAKFYNRIVALCSRGRWKL